MRQQLYPTHAFNYQVSLHILVLSKRTRCPSCYKKKVEKVGRQLIKKKKTVQRLEQSVILGQIVMCKEGFFKTV